MADKTETLALIGWEMLERELRSIEHPSSFEAAYDFFLETDLDVSLAMVADIVELLKARETAELRSARVNAG